MSRRLTIGRAAGTVIAAIYCFTLILTVLLPGRGAWLSGAEHVLFPPEAFSLGMLAFNLYRRQAVGPACREREGKA